MRPMLAQVRAALPRWATAAAVPALMVLALVVRDVLRARTSLSGLFVDAVTLAVLVVGTEVLVGAPLRRLTRELSEVRVSGDLSSPITVPRGPVQACAQAAAGLVESVHSVLTKVRFTSTLVADKARHVQDAASGVTSGSELQEHAVRTALVAVDRVLEAAEAVDGDARGAAGLAGESLAATRSGAGNMAAAREQMQEISAAVASTVAAVDALGERVRSIDEMVAVVSGIAEQTNLLALNATIESARAGESGRGFAVVAHEVGQLAEHTTESTRQITEVVDGVRRDTEAVLRLVGRTASLAEQGAALTAAATTALGEIETATQQTTASIGSIQQRASGQRDASRSLRGQVDQIEGLARANRDGAGEVHGQALGLDHLAENLREIENVFALGPRGEAALALHLRMPDVVVRAAADVAQVLQRLVDQRRLGPEDLFDEAYQPIPGTVPQKFHTRYDALTDEVLPAIQEPILDLDPNIVYAGAVDRRGYFPTHNRRFSKPLTGDPAVDLVGNRTKRIFDDPVGRRCGSHDLPFLVQTYRRDTGEVVHDISAPIVVGGRQWGGFRIGYRA